MRMGILGLGEIGTANKKYYGSRGIEVFTYDPKYNDSFEMPECDIYLICSGSDDILIAANNLKNRSGLVSIESTSRIGTSRDVENILGTPVIYCPQRYWERDPEKRGVRRLRLIGATRADVLEKGIELYSNLDMPLYPVEQVEVAELAKVAENAYRGLQIAFAQELFVYCQENNIPFASVRKAIMTSDDMHWIAEARKGIEGHCLPMAMNLLSSFETINAAIRADKKYRETLG